MVLRNLLLTTTLAPSFLLFASLAASQDRIIHETIPGDPWNLTFAKLAGDQDGAMPDPTVAYDPDTERYRVTAAGHGICDSQDGSAFAYLRMPTGEWSVGVRLDHDFKGPATSSWSKAGVMVRDWPTSFSKFVLYSATRGNGQARIQWRDSDYTAAASPVSTDVAGFRYPLYLRLDRVGNEFTGYYSTDGRFWTQGSSHTNDDFTDPVHIGFALTSGQTAVPTTMTFSSFSILSQEGPVTRAIAGPDQWVYGGDSVTLDGSSSWKTTAWHWEQVDIRPGDPVVTLSPSPDPPDGICAFVAPSRDVGYTLTFRLTVTGETGSHSDDVLINVRSAGPPLSPVSNLRVLPVHKGFWAVWDPLFDAATYEVVIETEGYWWIPWPVEVSQPEFWLVNQPLGKTYGIKIIPKNANGAGPESVRYYYTIMPNLALPEPDGATPPLRSFDYDGNPVPEMNDGVLYAGVDSSGTTAETEDFWGYEWDQPLYFDRAVYVAGEILYNGGWFTACLPDICDGDCGPLIQYTEDGTTWKSLPTRISPPYRLTDSPAGREDFARYDIIFPVVRGTGIRLFGTPGGMDTFTSMAEFEVYGDQTRPANFIFAQGIDGEFAERTEARLDGSYSLSAAWNIVSHSWEAPTGFPYELVGADTDTASFQAGGVDDDLTYVFSLTVEDSEGNTSTDDDVRITIKNLVTTADAGPDQQVGEGTEVTLDGSGSVSSSETISYRWTQIGEPKVTLIDPGSAICSFTAPTIWNFTKRLAFQLEVSDGIGGSGTDVVNVDILNSVFDVRPLPRYYFDDLLHLGENLWHGIVDQTPTDIDYLEGWGGEANINPQEGEQYDFAGTDVPATDSQLTWTRIRSDDELTPLTWLRSGPVMHYYHIYIFSPEERRATRFAWFRHDDKVRVWNNGVLAASMDGWDGGTEHYQNFVLNESVNSISLRVREGVTVKYVSARVTDRSDVPYTDLSYSVSVPNPLPKAYAVRELPASYEPGKTFEVKLSVRADPENLPTSVNVRDSIPAGTDVADSGGGFRIGNELAWSLTEEEVGITTITYRLFVVPETAGALRFAGNVSYPGVPEQEIYGGCYVGEVIYELPSPPTNVEAEVFIAAHLSWSPNPEEGIAGYRIYRSVDGGDWEEVGFVSDRSYLDKWLYLAPESTYSYRVAAVNVGGAEGAASCPTEPRTIKMLIREAEDFNYGGGLYPWTPDVTIPANEAPSADALDPHYDYYHPSTAGPSPRDPPPVRYRPQDDVLIETAPEADRPDVYTTNIAWIDVGSWYRYTFDVPPRGPGEPEGGWVKFSFRVASSGAGTIAAYWDETPVGRVSFRTGNYHIFTDAALEEQVQAGPGRHTLRVQLVKGGMSFDKIGIGFNWSPPTRETIFEEDFEEWTNLYSSVDAINEGWTVENGSGCQDVAWRLWNTAGDLLRETDPDIGAMIGNYAISDSDLDESAEIDEELISPVIDCTDYLKVRLDFNKNMRLYLEDMEHLQVAEVDIQTFDEETGEWSEWMNLLHWDLKDAVEYNKDPENVDISEYADRKKIRIRWHFYEAVWDYWFAIDDIRVSGEWEPLPELGFYWCYVPGVGGFLCLRWEEFGSGTYYIQSTDDLGRGEWRLIAGPLTSTYGPLERDDVFERIPRRFYRVVSEY